MTVGVTAGGLILAGAALSRYPWRSVDGYIGHSWGVQLLALIAVATLGGVGGADADGTTRPRPTDEPEPT